MALFVKILKKGPASFFGGRRVAKVFKGSCNMVSDFKT